MATGEGLAAAAAAADPAPNLDLDDLMDVVEAEVEVEVSLEAVPRRHGSMEAADIRPAMRDRAFVSV